MNMVPNEILDHNAGTEYLIFADRKLTDAETVKAIITSTVPKTQVADVCSYGRRTKRIVINLDAGWK